MLHIQFDLPDFCCAFGWKGDEQKAANLFTSARDVAHHLGHDETTWLQSCVVYAPELLRDESLRGAVLDGIAAFVLQSDTENAEHPGRIGDYLGAYDLTVVFINLDHGRIVYHLEATAMTAGSA